MRLQSALFCDSYVAVEGKGWTFEGVGATIFISGTWSGGSRPAISLTKKLALILLDGRDGPHWLDLNVQRVGTLFTSRRAVSFGWPMGAPSHLFVVELDMQLPGGGTYLFDVLIDHQKLATVPLQIIGDFRKAD